MGKIGFCFSGEGARGSIQAGIVLGLAKRGIKADFTVGVSSGAICASAYSFMGPEKLVDLWSNVHSVWDVFGFNWNFLWGTGVLNQRPAEKLVANAISNDPTCECVVSRMNINSGLIEYISNKNVSKEEFGEAVLGAFAIPGLVNDRNGYVDATFRVEAPLQQAINAGCTELYVILGRQMESKIWTAPGGFLNAFFHFTHSFELTLDELIRRDIQSCVRKNTDFDFKNIPIHVWQPMNVPTFEALQFRKCPHGIEIGLNNSVEITEHALRMGFKGI